MDSQLLPSTSRALLHRLAVAQTEGRAPSVVAAVIRDGERVWWGSRSCVDGHAPDLDVQFRIGSITKTFVGVLVMRLRDAGRLDLSDPLRRHLPEIEGTAGELTIDQLLTHRAGLTNEPPGPWWERTPGALRPGLADLLQQPPTRHEAGRMFHYSNVGYALLGAVVEQLHGEPWDEVLRRDVLDKLGMHRTTRLPEAPHAGGWAVHPWADVLLPEPIEDTGRMAPAGQLWSTLDDLCRWARFLADGDEKVLSAGTLAEMREAAGEEEEGYGLGLQVQTVDGLRLAGHGGSMPGFRAALWTVPDEELAVVVLTNTTARGGSTDSLATDLLGIVVEHEPRIPEPWRPLPEVDQELLALTGHWYWGPACYVLRLKADRGLELTPTAGAPYPLPLRAESDGTWTALDGYWHGESLRVVRAEDGTVSHLDLGTFVLTREPYPLDGPTPGGVDAAGWSGLG